MAINAAGVFLSQPPTTISASMPSAKATVSMESAMTSRLTSDAFIPSCPMDTPSLTVIVPNVKGTPPASRTPSPALSASLCRCILQGVTLLERLAMPMNGLAMSSSSRPMYSKPPTPTADAWLMVVG